MIQFLLQIFWRLRLSFDKFEGFDLRYSQTGFPRVKLASGRNLFNQS